MTLSWTSIALSQEVFALEDWQGAALGISFCPLLGFEEQLLAPSQAEAAVVLWVTRPMNNIGR